MNVLEILVNALYRQAEGNEQARKLIRSVAEVYNERMAEINRRPSPGGGREGCGDDAD